MGILKHPINWFISAGLSDKAFASIICIFLMFLIIKYGFMQMKLPGFKISIGSPWKIFGKLFSLVAIFGICYGIYLLATYCRPTPERLAFKKLSRNLAEIELKPEKATLKSLNEKVKEGKTLTEKEKREAMEADKTIESKRKNYSQGKLVSPQKPAPVPVYKWIFGFKADPEDIINAKKKKVNQICYRENDVLNKPNFDNNEIRFKYKTSKGKVVYAILDKKKESDTYFMGMVDLPDMPNLPKGRKLIIWLKETSIPDNFEGIIETWDGKNWYPAIPAFLKKVNAQSQ